MMLQELERREDEVVEAARAIANDPESLKYHAELSGWVDAQSAHTLAELDP